MAKKQYTVTGTIYIASDKPPMVPRDVLSLEDGPETERLLACGVIVARDTPVEDVPKGGSVTSVAGAVVKQT
jgi:hypothetical protein